MDATAPIVVVTSIDFKKLLIRINDEKDLHADLCLDLDCTITVDDPKPLVRSLNHIINYLSAITNAPLRIGLSAQKDSFVISFLAHPLHTSAQAFRQDLAEILREFGVSMVVKIRQREYAKVLLTCARQKAPHQVMPSCVWP
jgi:hypothetical protein